LETKKYFYNFKSINDELLDTPIYRVFPLEKILTSIHENQLFFVKTKLWEDPFEAFLLKQLFKYEVGSNNYPWKDVVKENFYGQCWTLLKETNFLWKIYAPNCDGIIVKSSIRKMKQLFSDEYQEFGAFYLGKVVYWKEEKIKEHYQSNQIMQELLLGDWLGTILNSLFIKREEFEQEEEVRLIFVDTNGGNKAIPLIKNGYLHERLHLFNELSDELIIDPRVDGIRAESIISLLKKLGFEKPIRKSTLFNFPEFELRKKN
jgi:hypothetical protein